MSEPSIIGTFLSFAATAPKFPQAKCREIADPDYFFPTSKEEYEKNKPGINQICGSCVHQQECVLFSINYEIEYGVWGAMPAEQRRRIWKTRKFGWVARKGRNCRDMLSQGVPIEAIARRWRTTPEQVRKWIEAWEKIEVKPDDSSIYLA